MEIRKGARGRAWPAETDKQIPHPVKDTGIPFDFAQGRRDDRRCSDPHRLSSVAQAVLFWHAWRLKPHYPIFIFGFNALVLGEQMRADDVD
jgi:hypothetical protein